MTRATKVTHTFTDNPDSKILKGWREDKITIIAGDVDSIKFEVWDSEEKDYRVLFATLKMPEKRYSSTVLTVYRAVGHELSAHTDRWSANVWGVNDFMDEEEV